MAEATNHPRDPIVTVSPELIANAQSYAAETQHGAAHVELWTRVLAAFGVVYHADPITAAEAEAENQKRGGNNPRWAPMVLELERIEEAIANSNSNTTNTNLGTIILGGPDPRLSGNITEGSLDTIEFWIKLESKDLVSNVKSSYKTTTVSIDSSAAARPDNQGLRGTDGMIYTSTDWDRLICHERPTGPIGDKGYLTTIGSDSKGEPEVQRVKGPERFHNARDLASGCPMYIYEFAEHSWNTQQKVSFMAGHDKDPFDHSIPVYVKIRNGTSYTVTINIIDDDKNKTQQEARDEYRIDGFAPHMRTSSQLLPINHPPSPIQVIGMGDGRATLQWDDDYTYLMYFATNAVSVNHVGGISDGSYEITGLKNRDAYTVIVCDSKACETRLGPITVRYVQSEYTLLGLEALGISDITRDTASVSWGAVKNADQYLIVATPTSIPPEFGASLPDGFDLSELYVSTTSYDTTGLITGLYTDTDFELYVVPVEVTDTERST